jgi:hypothetical protein
MGMDVSGTKPTAPVGKYFRRNIWGWHPLWDYCRSVSPLARQVKHGHSNDGDGLNAQRTQSLAKTLERELEDGRTSQYVAQREKVLGELPDEQCSWCEGTGQRPEPSNNGAGVTQCNRCKGTGIARPWITLYHFDERDVREFAEFLKHCGGFVIY